jgi:hypothetical protein
LDAGRGSVNGKGNEQQQHQRWVERRHLVVCNESKPHKE